VHTLTERLAACGFSVQASRWRDRHELIISNVPGARSCLTLTGNGCACWHYEPATGPATSAAALTAIIARILGAPTATENTPGADAYRTFPLKGAAGRRLQDRGLTVALQISEDLESFEATTEIEVTNPARPWLGAIRLADNGHLDWEFDYRAAFDGDPGEMACVIAPILQAGAGTQPARTPGGRDGAGRASALLGQTGLTLQSQPP
jgi:hypothetical protein